MRFINRQKMIDRLRQIGSNYARKVVIIQPRVRKQALEKVRRKSAGASETARLKQLDTLLVGAEANCRALGATLRVIGAA
jgi:hypothetical protein